MIEWGLCCLFRREPVRFRRAAAARLSVRSRKDQLHFLDELVLENAENLCLALETCIRLEITAFRINSELMPLATHPEVGYGLEDLEHAEKISRTFGKTAAYAADHHLRLSFHPDQFVVLNSPDRCVVENSRKELVHQTFLARLCGAGEINLHGGGGYGNKKEALKRLKTEIVSLPAETGKRLTLENDDRIYTPEDLLPLCRELSVPFVYDVHHHRLNPDRLRIPEATGEAVKTWEGFAATPHFHLSSPQIPWDKPGDHRSHADEIDPADFPDCWRWRNLTVDVEAKAKETALKNLRSWFDSLPESAVPQPDQR